MKTEHFRTVLEKIVAYSTMKRLLSDKNAYHRASFVCFWSFSEKRNLLKRRILPLSNFTFADVMNWYQMIWYDEKWSEGEWSLSSTELDNENDIISRWIFMRWFFTIWNWARMRRKLIYSLPQKIFVELIRFEESFSFWWTMNSLNEWKPTTAGLSSSFYWFRRSCWSSFGIFNEER